VKVPARSGASALAAALVGLVLAACGVTTTTQAYDASLIRQVGTGSDAVASVFPTLQAEAKQSTSNFSNPQTSQDTVLLFQGRLDKLSPQDLIHLGRANQASAHDLQDALRKLDGLATTINADRVDPSAHRELSAGAKKFIAAWNAYLASSAARVRSMRQLFVSLSPVYCQFQTILRDAYQSTSTATATHFDRARRAFISDMLPMYTRLESSLKSIIAPTPAAQALGNVVSNTIDARAIVAKVNQTYPSGALATQFRSS
jgi:hypothetical protein